MHAGAQTPSTAPGISDDIAIQLGLAGGVDNGVPSDIVLLLDNSGSMKANDPKFLTSKAVTEFINQLDASTRLAIVIFDQKVKLAFPLTEVTDQSRTEMLASLNQINYQGLRTNSPDGLERAIYELKLHAREDTERFIVFLTDGIVDTGDKNKDAQGVDWMRKELAADASDNKIRIFGIAFTDGADFKLIQSLAQQTEAEYYRAFTADEIAPVFGKIQGAIARARQKAAEPVVETPPPAPVPAAPPAPAPEPIIVTIPEQPADDGMTRYLLFGILGLLVVVILIVLIRRGGGTADESKEAGIPEVKLIDTMGVSGQKEYRLSTGLTQIGRVKGKESPGVSHIVINKKSVSRHHAVIEYRNHAFWLMDQGSGNGTTLNGQQISEERRLKHGDVIGFDTYEFMFMEPELEQSDVTVVQASPHAAPAAADAFDENETVLMASDKEAEPEEEAALMDDIAHWDFEAGDEEDIAEKTIPPGAMPMEAEAPPEPEPAPPAPEPEPEPAPPAVAETPSEDVHSADSFETAPTRAAPEELLKETEEGGFEPSKTMTPDEFDRLFSEIDKNKNK